MNCVANRPNLRRLREAVETGTVLLLWEGSEKPACLKKEGDLCHWIQAYRQQCHYTISYRWEQIVELGCVLSFTILNVTFFFSDRWSPKIQGRYSSCLYSGHGGSMYLRRFVNTHSVTLCCTTKATVHMCTTVGISYFLHIFYNISRLNFSEVQTFVPALNISWCFLESHS